MLEDFRGITIKGRCFENETTLEFFPKNIAKTKDNRVALVFGRNGSGKTTVTRAFTNLSGSRLDILYKVGIRLLDETNEIKSLRKNIFVFDERYIQSKLGFSADKNGLGTIVHFGNQHKYAQKLKTLLEREQVLKKRIFAPGVNAEHYLQDILNRTNFFKRHSLIANLYKSKIRLLIFTVMSKVASQKIPNEGSTQDQLIQEFNDTLNELTKLMQGKIYLSRHDPLTESTEVLIDPRIPDLRNKLKILNFKLTKLELDELTIYRNEHLANKSLLYEWASIRDRIRGLKTSVSRFNVAANRINRALAYIFMSKARLQISTSADGVFYRIKINDHDVTPTDISIGERNALALAYFFSEIMNGKELDEISSIERLIILDDPVSSFDHENKMGVLSYIMHEIENLKNSRFICLMHDLHSFMALASSIKAHDGKSGATNPIGQFTYTLNCKRGGLKPLNLETTNEYRFNFDEVLEYASLEEPEENVHVGNQMRRILEAYSTFVYRKGFEYLFYGELIRGENAKLYNEYFKNNLSRFVVNDESHLQGRIRSLTDCNSLFASIDDHEKQRAIRDSICLLYLINPEHILSLRDKNEEKDALKTLIEPWLAAIRENAPSLRAEDEIETRKIP